MTIALRQRALTSRFTMRFFRRQPELRKALAARLDMPADAFDPIDFIASAMDDVEPMSEADPLPMIVHLDKAKGTWRIEPQDRLLTQIIERLASGLPIEFAPHEPIDDPDGQGVLFDLNASLPIIRRRKQSHGRIGPDDFEFPDYDLGLNAYKPKAPMRHWESSKEKAWSLLHRYPVLVVGRRDDPYLTAVLEHDRVFSMGDSIRQQRATLLTTIGRDGVMRTFETDRHLRDDLDLHDIQEAVREAAACPEREGYWQMPTGSFDRSPPGSVGSPKVSLKSWTLSQQMGASVGQEFHEGTSALEPMGRVIRTIVAATHRRPIGEALKVACGVYIRAEKHGARRKLRGTADTSWLDVMRQLTNRPQKTAARCYQAVAICPAILDVETGAAFWEAEDGVSVLNIVARRLLKGEHAGMILYRASGLPESEMCETYTPLVERSLRLAGPLLPRTVFEKSTSPSLGHYVAALATIIERNPHVRPHDNLELRAIAKIGDHLLNRRRETAAYTRAAFACITKRRIARITASRLMNGRVRLEPRDVADVHNWLVEQIWVLDNETPAAVSDAAYRVTLNMRAETLLCVAAIRMRGYLGLKELSRRFHDGINRHYADRNRVMLEANNEDAISLRRDSIHLKFVLPFKEDETRITQMMTGEDLLREGAEMRHCVASYITSVHSGRCFILSVSDDAGRSTADLRLSQSGDKLLLKEHRGGGNGTPPDGHVEIIADYVRWLNEDKPLLDGVNTHKSEAARQGWIDPFWPIRESPEAMERMRTLIAGEVARIFLPPVMAKATPQQILDYIAEQELIEHLYDARTKLAA